MAFLSSQSAASPERRSPTRRNDGSSPAWLKNCLNAASMLRRPSLLLILLLPLLPIPAFGVEAEGAAETKLKAALLYRFATLAQWPDDAFPSNAAPVVLCVLADDPLAGQLEQVVQGKQIGERSIHVERIRKPARTMTAHLVFIPQGEREKTAEILQLFKDKPVLTIGDAPDFCQRGGMIRLKRDGAKFSFEINIDALKRGEPAGLKLNPQVLKLGQIVREGAAP
jgi:hypothetical protein